ncbi:MAG: hypothetical protein U0172_07565 [Nitrospiraceae bacterium]
MDAPSSPPPDESERPAPTLTRAQAEKIRRERSITATVAGLILLFALYSLGRTPSLPEAPKQPTIGGSQVTSEMVPLVTGEESLQVMFTKAGCPVCHTIPGIEGAKGREGPSLTMAVTGPQRLADPQYKGSASTVREYIAESIMNPGAYIVPGYPTHAMPRWYGQKLSAGALEQMSKYLEQLTGN